VLKLNKSP